ncbi:ATP-binding cassette domain-containing protein [Verrucomicrobiota bacterium]
MPRDPARALTAGIFLIPEDRKAQALFFEDSISTNVCCASVPRYRTGLQLDLRAMSASCRDKMNTFAVKARGPETPVKTLSGGNQQKVLLCRAAEVAPEVLLLDEPTRGIDVGTKAAIYRQMEAWTRQGWGIVWCSSELQELLAISDRVYVLAAGRVTAEFSQRPFSETEIMARAAAA